jgi:hypothetical protein
MPVLSFGAVQTCVTHANEITSTYGVTILSINVVAAVPAAKELQSSLAQGAVAAAEAQKFETVARGKAAALQASGTTWTWRVVARVAHTVARLACATTRQRWSTCCSTISDRCLLRLLPPAPTEHGQ